MIQRRIIIGILFFCVALHGYATNHIIKLKLHGLKNVSVLLAHYHAVEKIKYAVDTAFIDGNGMGSFSNSRNLEQGIYLVILPNYKNFEFLIGTNQEFEIEATITTLASQIRFTNSNENNEYQNYKKQKHNYDSTQRASNLMLDVLRNEREAMKIRKNLETKKEVFEQYKKSIPIKFPGTFLEQLISSRIMEDNKTLKVLDISIFKNQGFLNTPFFESKLFYYLDTLLSQNSDTLKNSLTLIFNNAITSEELNRYLLPALLNHYRNKTNYEELFLYVAENYYIPFVSWDSPEFMEQLQLEINQLKPTMIGSEAPNIYLNKYELNAETNSFIETGFAKTTLYQIKADYLIVVFWDIACDSCGKNILKLYNYTQTLKNKNVMLLSMNMDTAKTAITNWLNFIIKNGMTNCVNASPSSLYFKYLYIANTQQTIYILDKNKKIIARKTDLDLRILGY